ncbi:Peptidase s8 and s53 subtilisin kexin sedolisin [Fusarium keratoplasticum]|uniref:Peptidase s8 and s53 subtilisin kexin sedolisin n=1 Tax=Fusarium keratoplasticum TaxID=1328300 RepID=A0ACC0QQ17_9HYPO|nr:Peptidase s8 and s53 subtilisin kexin sedolisin [Fusarium keratoplasticum]KAI8663175.1 Peptidase s8 and s53 subtilisin kexin sedolisin [Fusarium keratoplasticum]
MTSTPLERESAKVSLEQSSFSGHTSSVDLATSTGPKLEELPSVTRPAAPGSMILGSTQAPGLASPESSSESERPFFTSDSLDNAPPIDDTTESTTGTTMDSTTSDSTSDFITTDPTTFATDSTSEFTTDSTTDSTTDFTTDSTTQDETTTTTMTPTTSECIPFGATPSLSNPTALVSDSQSVDDAFYSVSLPLAIGAFDVYDTNVFVSTNAMVTLGSGTRVWYSTPLPADTVPEVTVFAYWFDLVYRGFPGHGVRYEVFNGPQGRQVTFEWRGLNYATQTLRFHIQLSFYEDFPGRLNASFITTANKGEGATIGAQNQRVPTFLQWSYNTPGSVPDGTYVLFETDGGKPQSMTTGLLPRWGCSD